MLSKKGLHNGTCFRYSIYQVSSTVGEENAHSPPLTTPLYFYITVMPTSTDTSFTSLYAASREFYRMSQKTIVAARYVRNSDPSKKDTEVQQAQADALAEYARKMGYECPDTLLYKDSISALKHPYWEREDLMRLWDDAERGMFDVVLVTEFFRVARTSAEQYAVIEYLKRFKVELISITEKFEETPEGQLMFAIQGFLGSVEAEKIRIRTVRGKQHRASKALTGQGKYPTYGYLWIDGEEYTRERYILNLTVIHIDANGCEWTEVKVIEFCFDACLSGMSLYQIALTLTRLGIPTQRGKEAWDPSTIRRFLTNICYTGEGYNGKYAKEQTKLADGIYPKIISRETFDAVQRQLALNTEMSLRNNHHPKEGLLRGLVYCGLCGHKMQVKHFNKPGGHRHYKVKPPAYYCYQNNGLTDVRSHHTVTIDMANMDLRAWKFAVPYIKDRSAMRRHVEALRKQVKKRDHSQDLEKEIDRLSKSIANLYALAAVADPNDKDGLQAFQNQLISLQNDKRDKERLLNGVTSNEERQEKLLTALVQDSTNVFIYDSRPEADREPQSSERTCDTLYLDRFEKWGDRIRPYLNDPHYVPSFDDMREAVLVLGVKVIVWPASDEYEDRAKMTLLPPDIARFCDFDFTK